MKWKKPDKYRRAHPFNPPRSLLTYPQNFAKKVSNSLMVKYIDIVISHEYKPYKSSKYRFKKILAGKI